MKMNPTTKTIDVLLVDDDAADRRLVKLALAKPSRGVRFNIETAETLSEAKKLLSSNSYDILLLDLGLPDSSGTIAVRKIHEINSHIPIVVLTGLDDEETGVKALREGAEDYLVKGVDLGQVLIRIIRYAIERKKTEESLREERNFSQSIIETAQTIMLILDTEGKIVSFNPYMEEICGYRLEEVKGNDWFETILPQRDWQPMRQLFNKAISGIQTCGNVNPIVTKDGREVEIEWYDKTLKDIDGKSVGLLVIGQDVTERRLYEEKLKQSKIEAEEANLAKSQFLANMSHEVRTPMNAVIGFSDILAEDELTETQHQYVNLIRKSGNNLMDIINDILDISKIEAKQIIIENTDCGLNKLLSYIESMVQQKITEKGIDFEIIKDETVPSTISTDPTRLKQCLINLIYNAVKFTNTGYVHVNVSMETNDNQEYIRFDVIDTGIGIPADKQEHIFKPFTQADASHTRQYGGTGLGLAITKQLAKLLGGQLTLTSEEGKGSTFSLAIPANLNAIKHSIENCEEIEENINEEETALTELYGEILVAEDTKTNQVLIKLMLEKLGLTVTIAEDGNEALQNVLAHDFDLIMMDIQMPNMNGYEATKAIREKGITTPIIALTASAMKGDDKKCFDAGCDDYLTKPIDKKELHKKLAKYLTAKQLA